MQSSKKDQNNGDGLFVKGKPQTNKWKNNKTHSQIKKRRQNKRRNVNITRRNVNTARKNHI